VPVSNDYLEYLLDLLEDWGGVTTRKMFGGAGLYKNGRMFGLVADDVLYLKVNDSNREQYEKAGSRPFKPYPGKHVTMSYWEVPAEIMEDSQLLTLWSERSLAIQLGRG